ncbi:hypothetical protein [Actinoplanes sp. NPDC049265]|uniref:hypothetical protein n=1 Tax=Actinoplanes sp. NPDC049265 TaxID=3363902 RepID=UPI00371D199A
MDDLRLLHTVDGHGRIAAISLRVAGKPGAATLSAWSPEHDFGAFAGPDLVDCLHDLRLRLEADGLLLCCQGARVNVWPSGQLRQFADGRQGYVLTRRAPGQIHEVVDLLDPAPAEQVVTVEDQRRFVYEFHALGL